MKKIYALMAAGLMTAGAFAQDYKETIELTMYPETNWVAYDVYFDMDALYEALGTDYLDSSNVGYYNADGEFVLGEFTTNVDADEFGYWYTPEGVVTTYGNDESFYSFYNEGTDFLTLGQLPGVWEVGDVIKYKFYLANEGKIAELDITANIIEKPSIKGEVVETINAKLDIETGVGYGGPVLELDYAAIAAKLGCESITDATVIGVAEDGTYTDAYTAGIGFWYDMEGNIGAWGEGASVYINFDDEDGVLFSGEYPGHLDLGYKTNVKIGFYYEGKIVMIDVAVEIVEAKGIEAEVVNTQNVSMTMEADNEYTPAPVEVDVDAIEAAIGCPIDESEFVAYNDGLLTRNYTGDGVMFWFNKEGNVGTWGENASIYVGFNNAELVVAQMPDTFANGGKVTVKFGFLNEGKIAVVNLTYEVPGEGWDDAVEGIAADGVKTVYNLQGMKMNAEKLPAGLYIVNGKKIVIK